jgi:outer membrane protein assembly complex, YaeT protein
MLRFAAHSVWRVVKHPCLTPRPIGLVVGLCLGSPICALTLKDLDPGKTLQVKAVEITGNEVFSEDRLRRELVTKGRPWYAFWRERPGFDPLTFETDLKRLKRFYERHGYHKADISYDLTIEQEKLVTVHLEANEGRPVIVDKVTVDIPGFPPERPSFPEELPLKQGNIFTEEAYQSGEQRLRDFFLERGHAHVKAERKATVNLEEQDVSIKYTIKPGPKAVFGETRVEGTEKVDPYLILRELTYESGNQFSLGQIKKSRENILNLGLFRSVQVVPEKTQEDVRDIPMRVVVEEQPPRNLRVGIGYGTEDEFRGQVEWHHWNWLGGGRRLSFKLKGSSITRELEAGLVQPHFLTPHTRGTLSLAQEQEDEKTFLLNVSRFQPRIEHQFSPSLSGFIGYRLAYAQLSGVDRATINAIGGITEKGILSGPSLGLIWDTSDDPFDPKEGGVVSVVADQNGQVWGGDFSFFKLRTEAKKYQRIGWDTVLAGRLKIGIADAFGEEENLPLFERFFAGGEKSVRGYGRRRLGPLSASDDPIGGLSLVEGAVELRRPVWREVSGAVFLDFGQVSTRAFDLPFDELDFSVGVGVAYLTPVGPLRLDIGFPFDPPAADEAWQVHFSIGQFF